jgi:hypothetical protein
MSVKKSTHSSTSVNIVMLFTAHRSWVIVLRQLVLFSSMLLSNQMRRTFWNICLSIRRCLDVQIVDDFDLLIGYSMDLIEKIIKLVYCIHFLSRFLLFLFKGNFITEYVVLKKNTRPK